MGNRSKRFPISWEHCFNRAEATVLMRMPIETAPVPDFVSAFSAKDLTNRKPAFNRRFLTIQNSKIEEESQQPYEGMYQELCVDL